MPKGRLAVGSENLHTYTRTRARALSGGGAPGASPGSPCGQAGGGGARPDCWSNSDLGRVSWLRGDHCRPQLAALFEGPIWPPPFVALY